MDLIDFKLQQRLKTACALSPRILHGQNLLFTPINELAGECGRLMGDNPFFTFIPPRRLCFHDDIGSPCYENLASTVSLEEHLEPQIITCPGFESVKERAGASFWTSILNSQGYLNTGADEIAKLTSLPEPVIAAFIEALKGYVEPAGLYAGDLRESLLIQLRRLDEPSADAEAVLTKGIEYLLSGNISDFAVLCGWDARKLDSVLKSLKRLDPAPGKNFAQVIPIYPEVEFYPEGEFVKVKLIRENLPIISCNFEEMPMSAGELLSSEWFSPLWSRAKFVITRLGMRYRTLMKIALIVAERQRRFITGAEDTVAPLTYNDAALLMGVNTSTVFRAVKNTAAVTQGRTIKMETFFCRSLSARHEMSTAELRSLVTLMNKAGYSDSAIASRLSIPPRTVTYHRNKLNLTVASLKH